jgi:hypothetical protein
MEKRKCRLVFPKFVGKQAPVFSASSSFTSPPLMYRSYQLNQRGTGKNQTCCFITKINVEKTY